MVYEEQLGVGAGDVSLARPDPVVLELNSLHNQLKEKNRELGIATDEIRGLKASEVLKDKAVEELRIEVNKLDARLRLAENLLEQKNVEVKKLVEEKRDALAGQYAAEATLRRVYAEQKDSDSIPLDSVIAPLEAEIRMYKNEVASLLEDRKALERLTKSKESALLEAERILRSALERALIVEETQNQNFELRRQIEICQEENRILEKTNRQKVLEVEKLGQSIQELEEAVLAGGAAANAVRDYHRQIAELNEEKRTLERELARVKVSANRVASVVANEWKDENDKVMPVKKWLDERRLMQAEMQRLRDKLAVSERATKAEAQLKDKLKLRLKTLEEGLKRVSSVTINPGSPRAGKSNNILGFLTGTGGLRKKSTTHPRDSTIGRISDLHQLIEENVRANAHGQRKNVNSLKKKHGSEENMVRKSIWACRNKVVDISGQESTKLDGNLDKFNDDNITSREDSKGSASSDNEDVVSGFLYDRLQKEVISLRKHCEVKDTRLDAKEQEIKMLMKRVEALAKVMEVESKKVKREAAAREKEAVSAKANEITKSRNINSARRFVTSLRSSTLSFLFFNCHNFDLLSRFAIAAAQKYLKDLYSRKL